MVILRCNDGSSALLLAPGAAMGMLSRCHSLTLSLSLSLMLMSTSRKMMKRRPLSPNHIQPVSKEPLSGIMKAAIINHAAEGEGGR